jgi:hypothetical protein
VQSELYEGAVKSGSPCLCLCCLVVYQQSSATAVLTLTRYLNTVGHVPSTRIPHELIQPQRSQLASSQNQCILQHPTTPQHPFQRTPNHISNPSNIPSFCTSPKRVYRAIERVDQRYRRRERLEVGQLVFTCQSHVGRFPLDTLSLLSRSPREPSPGLTQA